MPKSRSYLLWGGLCLLFLVVFLAPVYKPSWFAHSLFEHSVGLRTAMHGLLPVLIPLGAWWAMSGRQLQSREKPAVWFLALAAAGVGEVIHYWTVDLGHYFGPPFGNNTDWQLFMHKEILNLNPQYLPHSYRFLPDCIVAIFTWLTGNFVFSRIVYRLLFNSLFYVTAYRYARVYVSSLYAGGAVAILAVLYPVSIAKYAGQFVDPASHLSFAICLYCLARNYEPAFAPNLFVGIFSKESVVIMPLCRAFSHGSRKRAFVLAAAYLVVAAAIAVVIRKIVNHGSVGYQNISGVDVKHAVANLAGYLEWGPLYLTTLGVLLPGTVLGWKLMDRSFQVACTIVVSAVVVSSILFSWLAEIRNLVPAFLVMTIVNVRYFESVFGTPPNALPATGSLQPEVAS